MKLRFNPYIVAAGVVIVILVAVGLVLVGGLTSPGGGLAGSAWRLTQINGRAPLAGGEPISLSFDNDQRAGGGSGCNSYGGEYKAAGQSLTISSVFSTMRACADNDLNTQEGEFLRALESVASFERSADQLTLRDASGTAVLVFATA